MGHPPRIGYGWFDRPLAAGVPWPKIQGMAAVIDLDLTDEHGTLCEEYAERNPEGTRALLAALNLQIPGAPADNTVDDDAAFETYLFEMAVYEATGCADLASIFRTAA